MVNAKSLDAKALCLRCDPREFTFTTTADLDELKEILGQPRALEAIRFGVGMRQEGYNIYALGPSGTGKHTITRQLLTERAAPLTTPPDWCYLYNFQEPNKPRAVSFPPGMGRQLRDDMARLVEDLVSTIPAAFESDEFRARRQEIEEELKERQEQAIGEIRRLAQEQGIGLIRTPTGFAFAPIRKDEVLSPEEFDHLSEEERKRVADIVEKLQEQLRSVIRQVPAWRNEIREKLKTLIREVAIAAAGNLIDALREKYAEHATILTYLNAVQEDVIENVDDFRQQEEAPAGLMAFGGMQAPSFRRYEVNVLVDRSAEQGVPVLYEDNPTYQNLAGRAEHIALMGALITDFTLIRGGALHRANGGYLLLDAHKLLMQPFAWEGLKRMLRSKELRIESIDRMLSLVSTASLEPEPIPLDVKVVLLGDRLLYYLLCELDPDFAELFKVAADFEETIDRNPDNHQLYARLITVLIRNHKLRHLDREAVARVIEESSRIIGDAAKLSTHMRGLVDLLQEADYWAGELKKEIIDAAAVQKAIDASIFRKDRVRAHIQESIKRGTLLIETTGEAIGQVNGLSVVELGGYSFGIPHRITARVRLGEGELIDIEREVEMGGPIHSKGVMILSGFLGSRYAPSTPLSLSATLVFEQSYAGVEGDSASSAELYALLSALADIPLKQSYGITGSINQQGQVQAVGGVNEKIEGYFDICKMQGLSGEQGVLIPSANVQHLMLRQDVVDAADKGLFHIYPVDHIDEGIAILSGMPAGTMDEHGEFPEDSFNHCVQARLLEFAHIRQSYGDHLKDKESS